MAICTSAEFFEFEERALFDHESTAGIEAILCLPGQRFLAGSVAPPVQSLVSPAGPRSSAVDMSFPPALQMTQKLGKHLYQALRRPQFHQEAAGPFEAYAQLTK